MKLLLTTNKNRARSTHTVLLGFTLLAMLTSVASSAPPSSWESKECASAGRPCPPGGRKFFPGFYASFGGNSGTPVDISAITGKNEYVGIVRSYSWRDLEPKFGSFDFSLIEADKAVAIAGGRKLGIHVRLANFSSGGNPVTPSYMWNDSSYGGVVSGAYGNYLGSAGNNIWNAMTWNLKVKQRFYALLDALGKKYNSDPNIAFVLLLNETTSGGTTTDDPNYTCGGDVQSVKDILTHAWSVLPNTPTLMELDWACTDIPTAFHQFVIDGGHGAWAFDARPCVQALDQNGYSLIRNHYSEIAGLVTLDAWTDIDSWQCFLTASQIMAELGPGKIFQPRYFVVTLNGSPNQASVVQAVDDWWVQHGKVWPFSQPPAGWVK